MFPAMEKMPPVWFKRGCRLTSADYKEVLETKVLSWAKNVSEKSDYMLLQYGAPAHTTKTVQDWLDANMSI